MMGMRRLDATGDLVTAQCPCGWHQVRATRAAAEAELAAHEAAAHAGDRRILGASRRRRQRAR